MVMRRPRPLVAAALIGLAAQLLFCWRLTIPHILYFDEVHYVPAARTLLDLARPANVEHPLLGKILIAAGIALFGDTPLGWRGMSALAGTGTVIGVFFCVLLMTGRVRAAVLGGVLACTNITLFVQARIAMLDGFMAAFVVWGVAAMLWAMRGTGGSVWRRWAAGGVLLGLAVGTKWTAVPYIAYAAIAFALLKRPDRWPGMGIVAAWTLLALTSLAAYFATFAPAFFYAEDPMTLARLIPYQFDMLARQTQVLAPHTYQSSWWTWPLMIRPIWYLYEQVDGATRGVLLIGNPATMWGGLVAVAACAWIGIRDRAPVPLAAAGLWAGSFAIWAIIPKSLGFYYYYYLPSLWLPVAIAVAFDRTSARTRHWDEAFLLLAIGLFAYFYPIISSAPLPDPQAFRRWMWLPGWP